jgi:CDP-4-dehydro-6-deoxyglucose reductase, E3
MSVKVTVLPSKHEFLVQAGETILDAALAAGIVLPYSCRDGACSTCRGRVISGTYDAGRSPARILPQQDLAAGYTLFCQAKPNSDLVIEAREIRMSSDIQIRKMPSRVLKLEQLTPDVMVLQLQLPAADPFRYYAGQYLEFILKDGRRRSYSIACMPSDDSRVELHIRHLPGGAFTDHVFGADGNPMKVREILRTKGPFGSFFLRDDSVKPITFLASGTGFAPIKAIIERMAANRNPRPAALYWGGRRPRDLYMHDKAMQWARTIQGFSYIPVVSDATPDDNWTGRAGFVHRAVLDDFPDLSGHQVYACGAPIMVDSARNDFVRLNGLPADEFFADAFTTEADAVEAT